MTLSEALTKAQLILNTYSIDGVANPDTYNNQADAKLRMRDFANAAQQEIARTNGRITKEFTYVTFENKFAYSSTLDEVTMMHGEDTVFTATTGYAYSIDICGDCEIKIAVGGTVIDTVTVYPTSGEFVNYKGVITNTAGAAVTITVSSDYDYLYRNVAIYLNKYPDDDSVQQYSRSRLITAPTDMIEVVQGEVYFNGAKTAEFRTFDRNIYIENDTSGMWTFTYYAQPQEITSITPLTYEFEVPAQTHDAIPFKMAYLCAIDIQGVSAAVLTAIKNEYAQHLSSVIKEPKYRTVTFTNVYGD